jgi:hypothetical protein
MTIARSWLLRSALVAGLTLSSAGASAQAPPGDPAAMAEALFQQARDLFKQAQYGEACPKFAESQRLDPKLGTLLNLAVCHEKLGKFATAWAEYTSAAAIARREGHKERESFARDQVAALEKRLARVIVQVTAPEAGLSVTLDDQPLAGVALSTPLPVDPGKHRIAATAPGKKAWSKEIEVPPERTEVVVPIPALEVGAALPAPPPVVPPPTPNPVPVLPPPSPVPPPAPEPKPESNTGRTLVYAGFGVGGAGVFIGAITGVVTLLRGTELKTACQMGHCSEEQRGDLNSANALANTSNVAFGLGVVGLGVGIAGLFMSRPSEPAPRPAAVTVRPILGPGVVGLGGSF